MKRKFTGASAFPQITLAAMMLIAADVARAQGDYPNRTIKPTDTHCFPLRLGRW